MTSTFTQKIQGSKTVRKPRKVTGIPRALPVTAAQVDPVIRDFVRHFTGVEVPLRELVATTPLPVSQAETPEERAARHKRARLAYSAKCVAENAARLA